MGLHTPERQGSGRAHRRATIRHLSRLLAKDPRGLYRTVARALRRYAKLARIGRTLGTLPLLGLSLVAASPVSAEQSSSPVAVLSADNDRLTTEIAVLIGAHNFALPLSFIPDPFVGIPAQAVTFGTNLGLKNVQAVFNTPGDWVSSPNSTDKCTYDFDLPRSAASYSNLLGLVNTRQVPEQWGDLTRFGPPVQVAHANTDVEVSVVNAHILPDQETTQRVRLPAGKHTLTWRAETRISDLFDIIIPAAFLGFNAGYYGAAFADQGASAARQLARQNAAQEVMKNIALEAGLITADQLTDTGRTTVTHDRKQEITIYDVKAPFIDASETELEFEAMDFGGVVYDRVGDQIKSTITAYDQCNRPHLLGNDAPRLLPIGTTTLTWTVRDLGPTTDGGVNTRSVTQKIRVADTQAPIMVAPPSRVIEVPAAESGINAGSIGLGVPRVVDLADPQPAVTSDSPNFYPKNSRTPILWTATDASGNASEATQLITVKTEGENTAPTVEDSAHDTLTSQPIDIVLKGQDADFLDGRFDPLSFKITRRPPNGEFIAPLFPFFIEDYRTSPAGPFGDDFRLTNNRSNWLYDNVCRTTSGPSNQKIPPDWVYQPKFVHVTDDGTYFMIDYYWRCGPSNASANKRISKWDRDGNYLGQRDYGGTNDAFVMDQDGFIYLLSRTGAGSSTTLLLSQARSDFDEISYDEARGDSWKFDFDSTRNPARGLDDPVSNEQFSYARVDSNRGLIYLTDRRRVFVYDVREDLANDVDDSTNGMGDQYLGALKNAEQFLCNTGQWGNSWTGFAMEVDPEGNLYVTDSCQDRIHKFTPSYFDKSGQFVMGDYVGWLGRCETSTNKACDEEKQISRGYSCTDETCSVSPFVERDGLSVRGTSGVEAGQFSSPAYIALDPNGVLYVADAGDPNAGGRIQRFGPDGAFGGEARSTGTGINQGERPGFVLGNLGTVKAVSVNSTQFFVVDQEESFIHVFETTPLKDITDDSATVTYVSKFNFHSDVDSFQYVASDGLADSAPGTVSIQVARNFRPPEALDQVVTTAEDQSVLIALAADDPDGVAGVDFNGLDRLSYRIVEPPAHGQLTLESADDAAAVYRYQPESDYFGNDQFTFIANDGRDDSEPATVSLTVTAVDDPPRLTKLTTPPRIGAGFPTLIHGQFRDDGADDHSVAVNWGDGSPVEVEGDFIEDEEKARLEGINLVKPLAGNGRGRAIGQHIYTRTGDQTVQFCIRDDQSRESCMEQTVSPQRLVNLGLQVAEPDAPVIAAGQPLSVELRIRNLEPKGVAGLMAETVTLRGKVSGAPVTFAGDSSGNCEGNDNGVFTCSFGALGVGEQRSVMLTFATDAQLEAETDAMLTFQARTETPAINKVTETFVMRRISAGANRGKANARSSAPDRRLFNSAGNQETTAEPAHLEAARLLTFPEFPEALQAVLGEPATVIRDAQQSADGQVMVFATEAALLPEDGNGVSDIYRFDVASHRLQRLSVGPHGQSADAPSHSPRMDGTGQRVVFLSAASNLITGIPGSAEQLYLHDEQRSRLIRLSETANGHPADAAMTYPLIDAVGERVVYRSAARNLGYGPGLYLHDLLTDQLEPIAFDEWGRLDGTGADVPAADVDLSLIAYQRPTADGLGGESTQVYLYDRAVRMTERVSPSFFAANGLPVSACCASVSGDGRYLAYREATVAGELRLILVERASGRRVSEPWPQDEALAEQAPVFHNENRELWWIDPLQGPQRESVLHRVRNPLAVDR